MAAVSKDAVRFSSPISILHMLISGDTTMTDPTPQPVKIDGYHAHVYYDPTTRERAAQLRETIASALGVEVRELSDQPRGPHPVPQFRFTFTVAQFDNIVPWL